MKCSDPNKLISSSGIEMKVVHYILIQTSCCFGCKCEQHAADVGKRKQQLRLSGGSVPVIQGMMAGVERSDSPLATPGLGYRGRFGYHTNNLCCQIRVDERFQLKQCRCKRFLDEISSRVMQRKMDVIFDPPGWWAGS